jgi:hypothetical protein
LAEVGPSGRISFSAAAALLPSVSCAEADVVLFLGGSFIVFVVVASLVGLELIGFFTRPDENPVAGKFHLGC